MTEPSPYAVVEAGRRLAAGYTLRPLLSRSRRTGGGRTGNEPGASLEFHEYRPYLPGDDLRRVDWGVYGRSDTLVVRQYQVELSAHIEIYLDGSASMGLYSGKSAGARFLASFLAGMTLGSEGIPVLVQGRERHTGEAIFGKLESCGFSSREDLAADGGAPSGRGRPVRILISDFLFESGAQVVERLGMGATLLFPLVLLSDEERNPTLKGPVHLVDAENPGIARDLMATREAIARYKERLSAHLSSLEQASRRARGSLHRIDVNNRYPTVDDVARVVLNSCLRAEMVAPA